MKVCESINVCIRIYSELFWLLLDSGADVSIINEDACYRLKMINPSLCVSPESSSASDVNGGIMHSEGSCILPLTWGTENLNHKLFIYKSSKKLILGNEFMKKYKLKLDLGDNTATINKVSVSLVSTQQDKLEEEELSNNSVPETYTESPKEPHPTLAKYLTHNPNQTSIRNI